MVRSSPKENYGEGRIKKVKIRNFMTYDYVEFYPKKGLNLILGLNGSGKSSIMCAISLALAGKTNFTGRAAHLSDFIKHGCQEAEIEVHLEKEKGSLAISRKLKGDKCEWFLNQCASNYTEVAKAIKCYNIDTSNLCQFLPQEKVAEFSRMDKKQRLENMLQTIGEPHLFQLFNELKELSKSYSEIQQNLRRSETKKKSAEEENERISDEVKKQENRARLKEDLDKLYKKRKVVQYEEVRAEVDALKVRLKSIKSELVAVEEDLSQAAASQQDIYDSCNKYSIQKQELKSQGNSVKNKITQASEAIRTLKEQAENENIEYKNRLIEIEDEKKRLQDLKEQIEGLKQYLIEERENVKKSEAQVSKNTEKSLSLQKDINSLYGEIDKIAIERTRIDFAIIKYEKNLNELRNEHNKKMENLKKRDRFAYEAACWLHANRHMFASNVYMPIMMEIKVHSSENCKYVEKSIPFRDMIAFVCENKRDYEKFTDIVAQKEWPVNVFMPPDAPIESFTSPPLDSQFRSYGLECYVSDLFTAPEPILRYLYSCYGIHRVPVAPRLASGQNINRILQKYKHFFSGNFEIRGKVSRYGNRNMSQKKDYITENNLLSIHNDDLQNTVVKELEILEEKKQLNIKQREALDSKLAELEKVQEVIRQEEKSFKELKRKFNKHEESYKQKVMTLQKISQINVEEEKQKVAGKIRSINEERMRILSELTKLLKEFVHFETESLKLTLCMNSLSKKLKLASSEKEDIQEKLKFIETKYHAVNTEYREKKSMGKLLLTEIQASGELSTLVEVNSQDIEEKINLIEVQLSIEDDNEQVVKEYNSRKQKIEEYQAEITRIMSRIETHSEDIEEKKTEWLLALEKHIKNINRKFSYYFKILNCAGEISLYIPNYKNDFLNYGLQIKLKFRDEEPLTELSISRHSGGECSVAAIVFILSLQELTDVPFRCIDEINQGMDSINERKIYQLIADSVGKDRCAQYLLFTPKLLTDLQYPEEIDVHIIMNSTNVDYKFNLKEDMRRVKNLR